MTTTRRQQAMDLIEQYQIDDSNFLAYLINDYMGGGELLNAIKSYISDELGVDTDEEAE
jgi:hypothetical protein